MIDPNGIAHIQLTVRDVAASRPYYYRLLHETFGMPIQYDVPGVVFYCIGDRTGVAVRSAAPQNGPWAPGYHSVLFEDPDGIRIEAVRDLDIGLRAAAIGIPGRTSRGAKARRRRSSDSRE